MNSSSPAISASRYDRSSCQSGIVHLGLGAFHRAHQAAYIDDYMDQSGDLRWGIAAVNLRGADTAQFKAVEEDCNRHDGYLLKTSSCA